MVDSAGGGLRAPEIELDPKPLPEVQKPRNEIELQRELAKRKPWLRPLVRAMHRDAGYLAVGLTAVYALSGLAVNHVADYTNGDASFVKIERDLTLGPLAGDENAIAETVRAKLGVKEAPKEAFRTGKDEVQISWERRTVVVHPSTGALHEEAQEPRFFIRFANWLHLNRGKKAWTYVADTYAIVLLGLAFSGLFMIPGRKGLIGRGAVLALIGAMIPVLYVQLAGGP
jgi:uncharacterized protein